jgi:hypothetical protein
MGEEGTYWAEIASINCRRSATNEETSMKVRDLTEHLRTADPGATVLFMAFGADLDEAVETSGVWWTSVLGHMKRAFMEAAGMRCTTGARRSSERPGTLTSIPRRYGSSCYPRMPPFSPPASLMTIGSAGDDRV